MASTLKTFSIFAKKFSLVLHLSRLFQSFKFGNGSKMSDENHVILEFKYLKNKKWQKQTVKSASAVKSYTIYYFHFAQITDKNLQFSFKNWQFSTFTTFLLHLPSSVDADFYTSSAYVMSGTKHSFHFQNIPASEMLNSKIT